MNAEELYKQVSQQLSSTLAGAQAINDEIHGHLRSAMISTFSKLDLVTREEFDAQRAVLMRSREKIDVLEKQLAELEASLTDK
ncbi:MAG: accessory factor UbiK family protein [Porticoccaceae bacterium]|nr:accessory factor UbiK family protein [Porticoccaceae bacterium]